MATIFGDVVRAEAKEEASLAKELAGAYSEATVPQQALQYEAIYEELYESASSGKAVSRTEREEKKYTSATLTYGEIHFRPFAREFLKLKHKYNFLDGAAEGGTFVDIGCGAGKAVFAAMLLHDFERCIGLEILQGLHGLCMKQLNRFDAREGLRTRLPEPKALTRLHFVLGDATVLDWSDADVVFANSTCFDEPLMTKLAERATLLKPGAFFITTTRKLPSSEFRILEQSKMEETWGAATVFIQRKRDPQNDEDDEEDADSAVS